MPEAGRARRGFRDDELREDNIAARTQYESLYIVTAYSFGNRWVGITGLRTPPPPEPLHVMAKRLRQASLARRIAVTARQSVSVDSYINALAKVRSRAVAAGQSSHVDECLAVERRVRSGRHPQPSPWVHKKLEEHFAPMFTPAPSKRGLQPAPAPPTLRRGSGTKTGVRTKSIVQTGWSTAYPALPSTIELPDLSPGLCRLLERSNVPLTTDALNWIKLACLHPSYVHENSPDPSITGSTLSILDAIGRHWIRVAALERIRAIRGEFSSSADCSKAMTVITHIISDIGRWLQEEDSIHLGRGELLAASSGKRTKASSVVASQVAGACVLVTASLTPVNELLRVVPEEIMSPRLVAQSIDWTTLLQNNGGRDVEVEYDRTGPDHEAEFSARMKLRGITVEAKASSKKVARRVKPLEVV